VTSTLAVGVMSGTSLDGVSTALVRISGEPLDAALVAFQQEPYSSSERGAIIDAIARGGARALALLHVALGERFAGAILHLVAQAKVAPRDLSFIASHGQTIWHEPGRATLQLGDPGVIAERTGVRVVSDFRSRDVAAGGQGAPLVPLADVMLFGHPERGRLLLNIGGMANVTWVPRRGATEGALAFDTGPGVAVIDAVTRRLDPDAPYDRDGERARRGRPVASVLDALLGDAYFADPPPKSTGRERFGLEFADGLIERVRGNGGSDNDCVATATALTVETVARAIERWTPATHERGAGRGGEGADLVISGGGAKNPALVEQLAARVRPLPVVPFEQLFFDGEAKEALAFAFLGYLTLAGRPGNLPAATGARGARVLGHVTPA
jgi:anhydro-N-acetylmuramic acid kinase